MMLSDWLVQQKQINSEKNDAGNTDMIVIIEAAFEMF